MPAVQETSQPFTLRAASERTGINRYELRLAVASGELPARQAGRYFVIESADLERFAAERRKQRQARRAVL